ncbi:unnamed protein product [Pseudo-nitzschia multistriata]|uniref:Uncharacterized protein n=1 Tax=Pseudo-nitzschia multistriata TaxID=183589 RepID=A0A448ZKI6_9STRA|nr:unnamed protein product [Pseudo-nitzschia multistriata]
MSEGKFDVGSIVRAKRGSKRCRAMVATVGDGGEEHDPSRDTVCILWEPIYPKPISGRFLIAPKAGRLEAEREQAEVTVGVETVEELLPFERCGSNNSDETAVAPTATITASKHTSTKHNIGLWKERGDQLLRLGDASAATSYYEKALSDSSSVSIGGSIVLSVEGFPRIAEVDCIDDDEDDGGTIDVTLVHNGQERSVKEASVLLGIMEADADRLQERILLNLARCMLQLSDLDAANRPGYLKSAVLAATLVLALSSFRSSEEDSDGTPSPAKKHSQTALVLRCKAYTGLSRWKNARSDARQLVASGDEKQGSKLLAVVERKKATQSKQDKKLAKEICKLVESATNAARDGSEANPLRY